MSRASELRDAIRTELDNRLDVPVDRFVLPRYKPDELEGSPRVVVRIGSREAAYRQGPDEVSVMIEVGVIGIGPDHSQSGQDVEYRTAEIDACDGYDSLLESVYDMWLGGGPLASPICEHTPREISPGIFTDYDRLERERIYLSTFYVTYRDTKE